MPKYSFIIISALLLSSYKITQCQTILNGVIGTDSTLSYNNSPYIVTANLLISPNTVVTIEPGVVLKFNSNVQILLRGKLSAIGTQQDSVYFTSDNQYKSSWKGILIENYSGVKLELNFFHASYADLFIDHRRYFGADTVVKALNGYFHTNKVAMDMNYALATNNIQYFESCKFFNHDGVADGYNSTFKKCWFSSGLTAIRNGYSGTGITIIDSCNFSNFTSVAVGERINLTNSSLFSNQRAITIGWYDSNIENNYIHDNLIGIEVANLYPNSPNQVVNNKICNNSFNVKLNFAEDFNMINNCWCLSDSAQIRSTMIDFFTSSGLGEVIYVPFDTLCNLFNSYTANSFDNKNNIKIFPNPSSSLLYFELPKIIVNTDVEIYNLQGKLATKMPLIVNEKFIDIKNLKKGMYILKIVSDNNIYLQKFIKE